MVGMSKRYEALVLFPDGQKEIVDASPRSGETPIDAIQRVLDGEYEPGGKILEIKEYTPQVQIYTIGGDKS